MPGDQMRPILHLLAMGIRVRGNTKFRVRVGSTGFIDTNMLVSQTQNSRVEGIGGGGGGLQWNIGFRVWNNSNIKHQREKQETAPDHSSLSLNLKVLPRSHSSAIW